MADRRVKQTGKDPEGDITALCGDWGRRVKTDAIRDIETNTHTYYVQEGGQRTDIHVVDGPTGKYLRSDRDPSSANNLDNLPDC